MTVQIDVVRVDIPRIAVKGGRAAAGLVKVEVYAIKVVGAISYIYVLGYIATGIDAYVTAGASVERGNGSVNGNGIHAVVSCDIANIEVSARLDSVQDGIL